MPVFALFAAGVTVSGGALGDVFSKPETLGVVFGLLAGKTLGVFGGAWAAVRFTKAELNRELGWADVLAIAALSGIGFTVSLLISELAFTDDPVLADEAKAAVLIGSLLAAVFAGILLKVRARRHRSLVGRREPRRGRRRCPRRVRGAQPRLPSADGGALRGEGGGAPQARRSGHRPRRDGRWSGMIGA